MAQAGLQHDGAALRKAGEDDLVAWNASLCFPVDQAFDKRLRLADSGFIFCSAAQLKDVVPGGHAHAIVDRDRALRRVGEDEAHW